MGRLQAEEMADQDISLETALHWHLQTNHYPPVPTSMIPVSLEAIEAANRGDWDAQVELPEGVSWRGQTTAPVWAIVEAHHLDPWIEGEDY